MFETNEDIFLITCIRTTYVFFFTSAPQQTFDQYSILQGTRVHDPTTLVLLSMSFISFHHNLTRLSPCSWVCSLFAALWTWGAEKMKDDRIIILPTTLLPLKDVPQEDERFFWGHWERLCSKFQVQYRLYVYYTWNIHFLKQIICQQGRAQEMF